MSKIEENEYFNKATMMAKSMFPGVFIYLVFAGMTEIFKWDIFFDPAPEIVKNTGFAFIALSVVGFPLAKETIKLAAKNAVNGDDLLKRMYYATIINLCIGETIAFFGVIVYLMSGDIRYFFLFFNICLLHFIVNRPTLNKWKKYMQERFTSLPEEDD